MGDIGTGESTSSLKNLPCNKGGQLKTVIP